MRSAASNFKDHFWSTANRQLKNIEPLEYEERRLPVSTGKEIAEPRKSTLPGPELFTPDLCLLGPDRRHGLGRPCLRDQVASLTSLRSGYPKSLHRFAPG